MGDALFLLVFVGGLFTSGFIFGCMVGESRYGSSFVANHRDKPYCETARLQDREYKRCWRATEVRE